VAYVFWSPAGRLAADQTARGRQVLFSVYAKGDDLLRQELSAMSPWHLRNIIRAYDFANHPSLDLETLTAAELIGVIMSGVRARSVDHTKASSRKSPP